MTPRWYPLRSSNLRRCAYDPETERLQVEFLSGQTYAYDGVPASVFQGLLEAPSAGSYFHREIKGVYG